MPRGRERSTRRRERGGLEARLGLDGLDVVGAVRRLVLGLLVLHGVYDLVVRRGDRGARDGADDEVGFVSPSQIGGCGLG